MKIAVLWKNFFNFFNHKSHTLDIWCNVFDTHKGHMYDEVSNIRNERNNNVEGNLCERG